MLKFGILTLSDRASAGVYEDISGAAIREVLDLWVKTPHEYEYAVISEEFDNITRALNKMCQNGCDVVFTTGGTGPAPRDITPEATEAVCQKMLPGFGELMRSVGLKAVPTAILSRQSAGINGKTLIINLPGAPRAIKECLEPIFPAIPYCVDLIGGEYIETDENFIKAFRPQKKG